MTNVAQCLWLLARVARSPILRRFRFACRTCGGLTVTLALALFTMSRRMLLGGHCYDFSVQT